MFICFITLFCVQISSGGAQYVAFYFNLIQFDYLSCRIYNLTYIDNIFSLLCTWVTYQQSLLLAKKIFVNSQYVSLIMRAYVCLRACMHACIKYAYQLEHKKILLMVDEYFWGSLYFFQDWLACIVLQNMIRRKAYCSIGIVRIWRDDIFSWYSFDLYLLQLMRSYNFCIPILRMITE